jgi:hypothetical protein
MAKINLSHGRFGGLVGDCGLVVTLTRLLKISAALMQLAERHRAHNWK